MREWWRLSSKAHWYGGDQGALWLLLADAINDTEYESNHLWNARFRGERAVYINCLKGAIPTNSRLLQRCLSSFLPLHDFCEEIDESCCYSSNCRSDGNGTALLHILDPRDYINSSRPMHFWSAMDVALNRRFVGGGLFCDDFVRTNLIFRSGFNERDGSQDLIVQTKNPREIACGAPCLSWATYSAKHRGVTQVGKAMVTLSVNEGDFFVEIPFVGTVSTAQLAAYSTCNDARIGVVDSNCSDYFIHAAKAKYEVVVPIAFRNDFAVNAAYDGVVDDFNAASPWTSRSGTKVLVCKLMREYWQWAERGEEHVCDDNRQIDTCMQGLKESWCMARDLLPQDSGPVKYSERTCRALVALNLTDTSHHQLAADGKPMVAQTMMVVSENSRICKIITQQNGEATFSCEHILPEWSSSRHEGSLKLLVGRAIENAHRSALRSRGRDHWEFFFQCTSRNYAFDLNS